MSRNVKRSQVVETEYTETTERLIDYDGTNEAGVRVAIPYDSSEAELFTDANPGKVQPFVKTLTTINGTKAASGDNELVAAPGAGNRLVVTAFVIQNESTTAVIMRLRSASTANGWRCLGEHQADGLSMVFPAGEGWELNENEALNLELSDADTCAYSVRYYTASV